jgi:hypothetical protein
MDQRVADEDAASRKLRIDRLAGVLALFELVLLSAQSAGGGRKKSGRGLEVDAIAGRFRRMGMSQKIAEAAAQLAVLGLKNARAATKAAAKTKKKRRVAGKR